ncbi:hypothetical protein Dimus_024193, partial [Dionaea muscipula]
GDGSLLSHCHRAHHHQMTTSIATSIEPTTTPLLAPLACATHPARAVAAPCRQQLFSFFTFIDFDSGNNGDFLLLLPSSSPVISRAAGPSLAQIESLMMKMMEVVDNDPVVDDSARWWWLMVDGCGGRRLGLG